MRNKLEKDYLCPALRGYIQYFATSYSKCPDHEGRAAVRLDGEEVLDGGGFDQREFYSAFQEFDNQAIEESLCSPNPLVRMFDLLDRRVGKRRLCSLRKTMERGPEWLRFFYILRLKAEGMTVGEGVAHDERNSDTR